MQNIKVSSVIFVGMILFGVLGYYALRLGFYPIAVVNGAFVGASRFTQTEGFVKTYYDNARKVYNLPDLKPGDAQYEREIARATLDQLVSYELMKEELEAEMGNDLGAVVDQKIENTKKASGSDFAKAVETVYGISVDRFKDTVLVPEAREEILRGRLFAAKKDFDEWLTGAKKNARVMILHPDLQWDGGKVVIRERSH